MKRSSVVDDEDDSVLESPCQCYLKQVRDTLGFEAEKYQYFISLLNEFGKGDISISSLIPRLNEVLSGHDHLLRGLRSILPSLPPNNQETTHHKQPASPKTVKFSEDVSAQIERATDFCNKVRRRFSYDDNEVVFKYFLDVLSMCYDKNDDHKAAAVEVEKELKLLFKGFPDLLILLTVFMADFYVADDQHEQETWEAIKRGRRDETPHEPKKEHPCREMLFNVDDDQCTYDVVLVSLESTIKRIEEFVERVKEEKSSQVVLEDYISAVNLRCIEEVYGRTEDDDGYGQYIIELLRVDPIKNGANILRRLSQKVKELEKFLKEATKVWAEARKNLHEKLQIDQLC